MTRGDVLPFPHTPALALSFQTTGDCRKASMDTATAAAGDGVLVVCPIGGLPSAIVRALAA
jgi:hypothetical protein